MADEQGNATDSDLKSKANPPQETIQVPTTDLAKLQETLEGIGGGIKDLSGSTTAIKNVFEELRPNVVKVVASLEKPEEPPEPVAEEPSSDEEEDLGFTKVVKPQVRNCNFEDFMSRRTPNDTSNAIELLIMNGPLKEEQEKWEAKHAPMEPNPFLRMLDRRYNKEFHKSHDSSSNDVDESWIQQIRINSEAVLKILNRVSGKLTTKNPITFARPFRFLIHFHEQMRTEFESLKNTNETDTFKKDDVPDPTQTSQASQELKGSSDADADKAKGDEPQTDKAKGDSPQSEKSEKDNPSSDKVEPDKTQSDKAEPGKVDSESGTSSAKQTPSSSIAASDESDTRQAAIAELQCYIDFVDKTLLPYFNELGSPTLSPERKIRFDDLWCLFRPGEKIYVPKSSGELGTSSFQTIWRLYQLRLSSVYDRTSSLQKDCSCDICDEIKAYEKLTVYCYYIDYTGESYQAVRKSLTIERFEGFKEVRQLPFYPLRCLENHQSLLKEAQEDGQKYIDQIKRRYGFYSGWTLIESPAGDFLTDKDNEKITTSAHVQSDVVVDFSETLNAFPLWKPKFQQLESTSHRIELRTEKTPMKLYTNPEGSDQASTLNTTYLDVDGIDQLELNTLLEKDVYLAKQDKPVPGPAGEDLALLPRRVFAYALWARRFVHVDVRSLKHHRDDSYRPNDKPDEKDALDQLQINLHNKRLISSLIDSHFKEEAMIESGIELDSMDFIRGKGKGVVILLHGVPGVGKTATAEAVAQHWGKPLFPITCGDLGVTAQDVQTELEDIFRLAHKWGCVLLLDEADVFITQRERHDLKRNALVAVFLRMLEYYHGILFLTTNRAGALDEAMKSRVHLSLWYNHLDEQQTVNIFRNNIERLLIIEKQKGEGKDHRKLYIEEDEIVQFSRDHYKRTQPGMGRWNGRQIRNAFLVAASLAHYEGKDKPAERQKQLGKTHFEDVERAIEQYDRFRESTLQGTDSDVAYNRYERDDNFVPNNEPPRGDRQPYGHNMNRRDSSFYDPDAAKYSSKRPGSFYHLPNASMPPPPPPPQQQHTYGTPPPGNNTKSPPNRPDQPHYYTQPDGGVPSYEYEPKSYGGEGGVGGPNYNSRRGDFGGRNVNPSDDGRPQQHGHGHGAYGTGGQ